jgi:hypothetical protein
VRIVAFADFRRRLDRIFGGIETQHSVAHQLVDLSDLFQKIASIYAFAREHKNSSFQNPIIFQVVDSALTYGVCIPIRRLADGTQHNEISLFKLASEMNANCTNWSRQEFLTWDGGEYDPTALRGQHEKEVSQILGKAIADGKNAAWLPIGPHEEIVRRHLLFDYISDAPDSQRSPTDVWKQKVPIYLLNLLTKSTSEIVRFANTYLAHRVLFPPHRKPEYNVSLNTIELCITTLWNCYNIINSIFYDSYMTPDIVHSLSSFEKLDLALVNQSDETAFVEEYERIKSRMEKSVNLYCRDWQSECLKSNMG